MCLSAYLTFVFAGFTGILLVLVICIIYIFATQTSRRLIFNAFWWSHKVSCEFKNTPSDFFFKTLQKTKPGTLSEQSQMHTPTVFKNKTKLYKCELTYVWFKNALCYKMSYSLLLAHISFIVLQLIAIMYVLTILHGASMVVQKPMFFMYFVGPAVLFTIDKVVSLSRKRMEISIVRADNLASGKPFMLFSLSLVYTISI